MANKKQDFIFKIQPHPDLVEYLQKELIRNGSLKLVGLGIFKLNKMKARNGFNPYTRKHKKFPSYVKVSFSPTKQFKDNIQVWK